MNKVTFKYGKCDFILKEVDVRRVQRKAEGRERSRVGEEWKLDIVAFRMAKYADEADFA